MKMPENLQDCCLENKRGMWLQSFEIAFSYSLVVANTLVSHNLGGGFESTISGSGPIHPHELICAHTQFSENFFLFDRKYIYHFIEIMKNIQLYYLIS